MQTKNAIPEKEGKSFAVLELFTSEGCSSCPPADELLAKIQKETEGKTVYLLAYHVDYWDRLGWKDAYSSAEFSNRQVQYGHWLNVSPIYTPQLIVNGKTQFVGSDESAIRHAISEQMSTSPVGTLTLQAHSENGKLRVEYHAIPMVNAGRVLIAMIQKAAQTKVERGENAGRRLSHVQVVRKLQTAQFSASGNGRVEMVLPMGFNINDWEVLGLVQDQNSGEIQAAARADLKRDTIISAGR
jgi:hypothetical protein